MNFKKRLLVLRQQAHISQKNLANQIGVCADSIKRWEHGQREPHYSDIVNMARAMGVTPAAFFGEEPTEIASAAGEKIIEPAMFTANANTSTNTSAQECDTINVSMSLPFTPEVMDLLHKLSEIAEQYKNRTEDEKE